MDTKNKPQTNGSKDVAELDDKAAKNMAELKSKKVSELIAMAKELKVIDYSDLKKQELIFKIIEAQTRKEEGRICICSRSTGSASGRIRFFKFSRL